MWMQKQAKNNNMHIIAFHLITHKNEYTPAKKFVSRFKKARTSKLHRKIIYTGNVKIKQVNFNTNIDCS